jgi:hypothetical protein
MASDYPAAHSADTTWFAVDRDGHVAVFDSAEAGAVPAEAFAGEEADESRDRPARILPTCGAVQDLRGRRLPGVPGQGRGHHFGPLEDCPVLMFLASLDPADTGQGTGVRGAV